MASRKNKSNSFAELVRQIESYGLKDKLHDIAVKQEKRRPFKHLPKQFSKGILIGHIAIVPKKDSGTRYVYIIADMMEAKILYHHISLKQTAILVAHALADNLPPPHNVIELDNHFASQLFKITNAKRMMKLAHKQGDEDVVAIQEDRLSEANNLADHSKAAIQQIFASTFRT